MKIEIKDEVIKTISQIAHINGYKIYLVGGYVRDLLLGKPSKDIDITVIGNGIEFAKIVCKFLENSTLTIFKNFLTAHLNYNNYEIEIVSARKESYKRDSRKPIVSGGTLYDDIQRRDFTINSIAVSLENDNYGEIIDFFGGINDLKNKIIKTTNDPNITFSDDPLRMLRAIRFATTLDFYIEKDTFLGIKRNVERINIVSVERITEELNKILLANKPSKGFILLQKSGLLKIILPELSVLEEVINIDEKGHKNNFIHTMKVLDKVKEKTNNLWLLWATLLHDIGKHKTKMFDPIKGWTFHNHNIVGAFMAEKIFKRLKLPLNEKFNYVSKLIKMHLRPFSLLNEDNTDSSIRRLIFEAGDDLEDLLLLAESDITTKNIEKLNNLLEKFSHLRERIKLVEEKDRIRNFKVPVNGNEIMKWFNLQPCKLVGILKNRLKDAILDGKINNDRQEAIKFLLEIAKDYGLSYNEKEIFDNPNVE